MKLSDAQAREITSWPLEDRDAYEETAGHKQFDAGLSRDEAELAAYLEVRRNRISRAAKPGGAQ